MKNAVFLLSDNKYLPLTLNTIKSFKKNNAWFEGDINILFCEKNIPPSKDDIHFLEIDRILYRSNHFGIDQLIKLLKIPESKYKTIFKIDLFKHHDRYNKILFLDSDIIVFKSLKSLFLQDESMIYRYQNHTKGTNSGVVFSVENYELFDQLMKELIYMSKSNVEEPLFSKCLTHFKDLDEVYNSTTLKKDTIIYHMQFLKLSKILEIQNEYNLL